MRYIDKEEIENIAIGAALLGTGGGGDPYIGKLMALQAIEEYGPIKLLSIEEIPDDALIVPSAMMGAPTVMVEKVPSGEEAIASFETIKEYLGKDVFATMPIEAGGVNSLLPLALAARLGLPVIDADGMGRAFPELQMVTFYLDGVSATPMVLSDEKGNDILLNTINSVWAERIARSATIEMGGSVMLAIYPMDGKTVKQSSIHHSLTYEEQIGRTIRNAKNNNLNPIDEVLKITKGYKLFSGKVSDINRRTQEGFAKGEATIEGLGEYKSKDCFLHFQNEHLLAETGEEILCVTPDLIAVLDSETGMPITTEGLRYGTRCVIIGIPSDVKWRTKKGIEVAGPRYFGYDLDFTPVEQLMGKGEQK
ncbi:hypothetical protein DFO73_11681 [Cytobacillus oceanisediminis]|jgi:DUF917 family protein|uniref:DUF917 domain-containing protein n=1 Tax=Cytobacillus oceanisediminis TaxID=665099 RepID=A0A2V2ZMW1_9BACI|nr:DUF917 domain-containing protein [Cytobacillus oceanisediminis]PWW20266.1 hypothetical protein DFO73_11681 [Cytobacillus oceanisediminis]